MGHPMKAGDTENAVSGTCTSMLFFEFWTKQLCNKEHKSFINVNEQLLLHQIQLHTFNRLIMFTAQKVGIQGF